MKEKMLISNNVSSNCIPIPFFVSFCNFEFQVGVT